MKKKLLVAYSTMVMGGSTTSLLALLSCLDKDKYDVELQLYRNEGELLEFIPSGVTLLPPAAKYGRRLGKPMQLLKGILNGTFLKAFWQNKKIGKRGFSQQVLSAFQATSLSKKNKAHYDYAIGFLEGWSDIYIVNRVNADKRFAWIHSTYKNIAPIPHLEFPWMKKVDRIVFVSEECKTDFQSVAPEFAAKTIALENILDGTVIQKRALRIDEKDVEYRSFSAFDGFKIATVCRIDIPIKGLDRAIQTATILKNRGRHFQWIIIGGGEQLPALQQMIREQDLDGYVTAIGERLNPYPYVKAADVYCMLSRYEGKPMTVTESKIIGTPLLITEYLSAHTQVIHGSEGIIIENNAHASVGAADYLAHFMDHPEALSEMKKFLGSRQYGNPEYIHTIEDALMSH